MKLEEHLLGYQNRNKLQNGILPIDPLVYTVLRHSRVLFCLTCSIVSLERMGPDVLTCKRHKYRATVSWKGSLTSSGNMDDVDGSADGSAANKLPSTGVDAVTQAEPSAV